MSAKKPAVQLLAALALSIFTLKSTPTLAAAKQPTSGHNVTQYYALYEGFSAASIPWTRITHLTLAFAGIDANLQCNWVYDTNSGSQVGQTDTSGSLPGVVASIKAARDANNPNVLLVLSVGGIANSYRFSSAGRTNATGLAASCVTMTNNLGLDGIDYDWEYPTHYSPGTGACPNFVSGGCQNPNDAGNFVTILSATRTGLNSSSPLGAQAHLSIAASPYPSGYYNIAAMDPLLTAVNAMAYEQGGCWSTTTNYNAGISWSQGAVAAWANGGATKAKVVMGTPYYSNIFQGVSSGNSSATGASYNNGCYNDTFNNVYSACQASGCNIYSHYNAGVLDAKNCYCTAGSKWFQYDDYDTTAAKSAFVFNNGYGGMLGWVLPGDSGTTLTRAINSSISPAYSAPVSSGGAMSVTDQVAIIP